MMARTRTRILVVDDDPAMREVLAMRLRNWDLDVGTAGDGSEAQRLATSFAPDVVLSDVVMPDVSGLELLSVLKKDDPERPVILLTAHGTLDMAVDAMKAGAHDFLTKPIDYEKLRLVLDTALRDLKSLLDSRKLRSKLGSDKGLGDFVGTSKPMQEVYDLIQAVGPSSASVLVTGESGTGKELVARSIHDLSPRFGRPFVAVNSAAIPKDLLESEVFGHEKGAFTGAIGRRAGCFENAHKGTLFLDEIAEMPMALQPKLLRVLEDGRVRRLGGSQEFDVDVRVVAATNRPPKEAIEKGLLREDLYFRLNVFQIDLPPLRRRSSDVPLIAQSFIEALNEKHGHQVEAVRPEAMELLKNYPWPGNVRELKNILERAVILAGSRWIELCHLPPYLTQPQTSGRDGIVLPVGVTAAEAERQLILQTLERTGNNKAEAARQLGLDVKTIRNKLKTYEEG